MPIAAAAAPLVLAASLALQPPTAAPPAEEPPAAPLAPAPRTGTDDWIQLSSGEWLKGEIVDLQDDSFVFDSDELDELSFDWDDVVILWSPRNNSLGLRDEPQLRFRDQRVLEVSKIDVEGDVVRVTTIDGEELEFTRDELRSVVPGRRTEWNLWSGKLSFGATFRSGNVDQTDISGFARLQRRDVESRLAFEYSGVYGEVESERTANNHRAVGPFDRYLTERLYWRVASLEYFSDEFQNIEYRLTPSAGFGYDIIERDGIEWRVGLGAGWQFTRFDEVEPGEDKEDDTFALLFSTDVEWELTEKVDTGFSLNLTAPIPEADKFNFRAVAFTEIDLWRDLDLDLRVTWDRQNSPTTTGGGEAPSRDDVRLYVGLGWSF